MASYNLPLHTKPFDDDELNGNTPQQAATTILPTTGDALARDAAAEKVSSHLQDFYLCSL
jgi:hypothetical protein